MAPRRSVEAQANKWLQRISALQMDTQLEVKGKNEEAVYAPFYIFAFFLVKNKVPISAGVIIGLSILFHLSVSMFLCQYHTVLMTVALLYNLKSGRLIPPCRPLAPQLPPLEFQGYRWHLRVFSPFDPHSLSPRYRHYERVTFGQGH